MAVFQDIISTKFHNHVTIHSSSYSGFCAEAW